MTCSYLICRSIARFIDRSQHYRYLPPGRSRPRTKRIWVYNAMSGHDYVNDNKPLSIAYAYTYAYDFEATGETTAWTVSSMVLATVFGDCMDHSHDSYPRLLTALNFQPRPTFEANRVESGSGFLKLFTLLDLCVSSLRSGHANLLCIAPISTDDPRRESEKVAAASELL